MEKKVTKRDNFNAIIDVLVEAGHDNLADVMRHEIELLDNKAAKAKAKAAEKKVAGDELTDAVAAALTDELCSIADITEKVVFDGEISTAKVQYRLNQLVKNGKARKEQVKVGDRKLMGYATVAPVDAE